MIQRVQSIWFFLAAISLLLLIIIPLVSKAYSTTEQSLLVTGIYEVADGKSIKIQDFIGLFIGTTVTALVALINIFAFKNRTLQKRIATVNILLIIGLCLWIFQNAQLLEGALAGARFEVGTALPILAIIFLGLGIRGINKDEQLIRSADRLR